LVLKDTFSFANDLYLIESPLGISIARQVIEIHIFQDNTIKTYFAGSELIVSKVVEPSKSALFEPEIQKKIDAIKLAERIGNVAEAARISEVSRETIYKNRKLLTTKGPLALKRTFDPNRRHKNRVSEAIEKRVVNYGLLKPHLGPNEVSRHLKAKYDISISAGGIRNIWIRHKMQTIQLQMEKIISVGTPFPS
jgi:hypothetical protein